MRLPALAGRDPLVDPGDRPVGVAAERGGRRTDLLLGALVLVVFALTCTRSFASIDVISVVIGSEQVAATGHVWVDGVEPWHQAGEAGEAGEAPPGGDEADPLWIGVAPNGKLAVQRSPGAIAAGVPAYAIARWVSGGDVHSVLPGSLTAAALAALTILLLMLTVRPLLGRRRAWTASLALAFTTPMWTTDADALWTHTVTTCGLGGMALAISRERWWLAGCAGGVALCGRSHLALIVAIVGCTLSVLRRDPRIAGAIGAASVGFLGLCSVWSHEMYGSWNPLSVWSIGGHVNSVTEQSGIGRVTSQVGMYLSPDRGVLVWTPVLLLLAAAVVRGWRLAPDWTKVLAVAGVVYTAVQASINAFGGGDGFYGYRHGLELLVCVFPLYAVTAVHMGRVARVLIGPVLGVQLLAMILGATTTQFLRTQEQVWTDNAFWYALRTEPALLAVVVLFVAGGALVARRLLGPGATQQGGGGTTDSEGGLALAGSLPGTRT